ncbi:MAG: tetratricopeptide repeat protein [Opitutales bacterium]|nr:tetratricopeptide repeat protein [Opitutales bacterium]
MSKNPLSFLPLRQVLRLVILLAVWATLCAWPTGAHGQNILRQTMDEVLQEAIEAFRGNDFTAAVEAFAQLERDFGQRDEFQEPDFLRRILPLQGFSLGQAGNHDQARQVFKKYLKLFSDDPKPNAFVLFQYASVLRQLDRNEAALQAFGQYARHYPERLEGALATLQVAELLFTLNRPDEAISTLRRFADSEARPELREQARLQALHRSLQQGQTETALTILTESDWDLENIPDLISLAMAALQLGEKTLQDGKSAQALTLFLMVPPHAILQREQEKRLAKLREITDPPAAGLPPQAIRFYETLERQIANQLAGLQDGEDYTGHLQLLRAQAFLRESRYREAWLLLEAIALEENFPTELREQGHYRWIVTANALELTDEALTIARNFVQRYPDSELAPQAFTLIAQTHAEARRFEEANEVLSDLIELFPDHPLAQRWLFTRGYHLVMDDDFSPARQDFRRARDEFSQSAITVSSAFWHALSLFFDRRYEDALEEFETMARTYRNHPIYPEILYRRAATHYAMEDHDQALRLLDQFLSRFERHPRTWEARVLEGDVRMGLGELNRALATFRSIPPAAGSEFVYATFQIGKILRATEDLEEMAKHFEHYLTRTDAPHRARISEALYWTGWALLRLEKPEEALALYIATISLYGNDREAGEIASLLTALERLHRTLRQENLTLRDQTLHTALAKFSEESEPPLALVRQARHLRDQFVRSETFGDWLREARAEARQEENWTWFARLSVEKANRLAAQNRSARRLQVLFQISDFAPLDQLDATALASLGEALQENGLPGARECFEKILSAFPKSLDRAVAFYHLGQDAFRQEDYRQALEYFEDFASQTPFHPLAHQTFAALGETYLKLDRPQAAIAEFEELLRDREARGRPHARALVGLGQAHELLRQPKEAIAYYQRVYTLYRAQENLLVPAYLRSAALFIELGDPKAAYRTYEEFIELGLDYPEALATAREARTHLLEKHPELTRKPSDSL